MTHQRYKIGQISISKVNLKKVIEEIGISLKTKSIGYICVTNSRTAYHANRNKSYCEIQNTSMLTVPDGMPLVWIAHNKGFREVGKVSGIDLMNAIFEISNIEHYSHYFYGSTPQSIKQMQFVLNNRYPDLMIRGVVSPPFQSLEKFDIDSLAKLLNHLKPTFFWCGLGAPKQERFIAKLQPKLECTICIGVGLAFEYIAGTVKRAPLKLQNSGLEWMYRLLQQPKNIKRAIYPLSWILKHTLFSLFTTKPSS